jgi:putative FmdB family regulatory protein
MVGELPIRQSQKPCYNAAWHFLIHKEVEVMPLYTYQCDNCGVQFEQIQKFTDKPIKRCPECNKSAVRRLIQPAGIIFKGSGWYKTDNRSSSSASSSSTPSTSKDSKAETKSETKTESKTPSSADD